MWGTDARVSAMQQNADNINMFRTDLGTSLNWFRIKSARAGGLYTYHMNNGVLHYTSVRDGNHNSFSFTPDMVTTDSLQHYKYFDEKISPDIRRRLSYWIWEENYRNNITDQTKNEDLPTIDLADEEFFQKKVQQLKIPALDTRIDNVLGQIYTSTGGQLNANLGSINGLDQDGTRIHISKSGRGTVNNAEEIILLLQAASYCTDNREFAHLLGAMRGEEFLEQHQSGNAAIRLTLNGYRRAQELQRAYSASTQAFVAMWFDDSMTKIYEQAIEPAIKEAGYVPARIDRGDHSEYNGEINDEIIAQIRASKFLVADFTTEPPENARGGVYYEAGFAHGLNKPVIFMCREDVIEEIHFDTRQYNHIVWKNDTMEDLKKRLKERIEATMGRGPVQQT